MPLSEVAVRNAKPRDKPYKLYDGGGLYLLVAPTGSRLWRMKYREGGKEKLRAFGAYPTMGLRDARDARDRAKLDVADIPSEEPPAESGAQTEGADTFKQVAEDWLRIKKDGWVPAYHARVESRLVNDVFPEIGNDPITQVTSRQVLALLRKVEDRGAVQMAKRIRQYISGIFVFAIAEDKASTDPASSVGAALRPGKRTKHRTKLPASALPEFLRDLHSYDGEKTTRLAIELVLHTWVRPKELRLATWPEIDGDFWRIPADRMKMSRDHIIPLTPQSKKILAELKVVGGGSDFIVPGLNGPISENTMIYGLYRMGYHSRATIHGFRGTASTVCNESGLFSEDWIEKQLAHEEADDVRAAYNAAEYLTQRVNMMAWWSDFIEAQIGKE